MKTNLLAFLMLLLGITRAFAAPVDQAAAQKAAGSFAQNALVMDVKANDLRLVMSTEDFYVYNLGTSGFVIISSDDCFRPVVGYSDEGLFPIDNPSPEMMYYLDNLAQGRQAALRAGLHHDDAASEEWSLLLSGGQLPSRNRGASFYLVKTKWDQNDPYNKFCPSGSGGRSYAGCVATAMSQVMNYWKYPTRGRGRHSYNHFQFGEISAVFSETTYNFDLMPVSISLMSPVEEINAVAEFMFHCGVAVDMMYDPDGSGAYSEDVPEAVMNYFGYSNRCRIHSRDAYSLKEFQNILKDQFDMGWPCYYSGTDASQNAGHAFVCDGYDDNDMFHFNWGWSGSGNGFFVIDGLDVSGYAFNSGQDVITNFVPSEVFENTMRAPEFFTAVPNGDDNFSVTLSWINPSSTLDGQAVDSIDQIVVTRNGVEVMVLDHPEPGVPVTCVDMAGLPVKVDYTVYAVRNGRGGRRARVNEVNLGPTCSWTVRTWGDMDWGSGSLLLQNASGQVEGSFKAESAETTQTIELPQSWITFLWNAPADSLQIGLEVMDSEGQPVFVYDGPSTLMPNGVFFETVNTCGGDGRDEQPSGLTAQVEGDDVMLSWTGIANPGYGYNIYRDGFLYTMVADTTGFIDLGAASSLHSYYVTAFCKEGETYPSNTVCTIAEMEGMIPRDFDYTVTEEGKLVLTWSAPENTENFVGYRIYSKTAGGEYRLVKSLGASYTSFQILGELEPGYRYYYKIVAMYDHGHVESTPAHALQHPDQLYLEFNLTHIPSNLTLQEQETSLLLSWDRAWRAETYSVYRNGELLAKDLTELSYSDSLMSVDGRWVYQVTGWVNGVESSLSNKVVYGHASVDEAVSDGIRIYPNPSTGNLIVEAESLEAVTVFNLAGQEIQRRQANTSVMNLDLSGLGSGVYLVRVTTRQGICFRKVVLKN